jgi:hypothetical protein
MTMTMMSRVSDLATSSQRRGEAAWAAIQRRCSWAARR